MQTTPAFVYLVPIIMLFGIGNVPGRGGDDYYFCHRRLYAWTIPALTSACRFIEAQSCSFGASPRQMLFKVQLLPAMPTIGGRR